MAEQYIRHSQLTAEGGGNALTFGDLRITFNIKQSTTEAPNIGIFRIYNLAPATAQRFLDMEFKTITFEAGYISNSGVIYKGQIKQTIKGRETPTETYLDILAGDGDVGYNNAVVNKTLKAGSTNQDIYDALMQAMQPYGITPGYKGDLGNIKSTRAIVLFGMARDYFRTLARSVNSTWSIQQGELQIVPEDGSVPGSTVVLNADTGMIGMPTQTQNGIMVRALINPAFKQNGLIQLDNASINRARYDLSYGGQVNNDFYDQMISADGIYRIIAVDWIGDTRGEEWYADMATVGHNSPTPNSQLNRLGG